MIKRSFTLLMLLLLVLSTLSGASISEKDIKHETGDKVVEIESGLLPRDYDLQRVVIQPNATVGKDTHIWENYPDNNYGDGIDMAVGAFPGSEERRALLQFELPDNIGVVKDVTLSVHGQYALFGTIPVNVKVHPLLNEWVEGDGSPGAVNWTYRMEDEKWDTDGGDFDEGIYAYREPSLHINTEFCWYSWDVTDIAKKWESGELENHGVMMVADAPSNDMDFFLFHSSDYLTASYRPKLTITYHAEIDPPLEEQVMEMNGPPQVVDLAGRERGDLERLSGEGNDGGNTLPFSGTYEEIRYQNLYPQEEIGVAGDITRISFNRTDFEIGNFSDFKISLGHSVLDSLTETFDDNYEGLLYDVFSRDNLVVNSSNSDSWVHLELDTAFPYDGSRNLLMDIQWIDSGGNNVFVETLVHGENRRVFFESVDSPTGLTDGTSLKTKFGVEVTDGNHFFWEAQSLDPNMFKAEVVGTELTITPIPNARGVGTLALSLFNNNGYYVTQEVPVSIGMKDTFIRNDEGNEYRNYGAHEFMYAGDYTEDGDADWNPVNWHEFMYAGDYTSGSELRSLLEFNLPPKTGELKKAEVSLFCSYVDQPGYDLNTTLSPITNNWIENNLSDVDAPVNWYDRTIGTPWNNPGGDFSPSNRSYRNISQSMVWYDWDITEIVKAWYNGDLDNNGLMITGDDHGVAPFNYVGFVTSDLTDDYYWPKLSISFGPEEIPDQFMEQNEPTRTIPLGTNYGVTEGISDVYGGTSYVPFNGEDYDECRMQTLYTPKQVGVEGTIKRISFERHSFHVGVFENLRISLAHTELDDLTQTFADNYHGVPVEVYSVDRYETNSSNGDPWIHFELNESFTYDSTYNLLVDLQWQGDDGSRVNLRVTWYDETDDVRVHSINLGSPTGILSRALPVTKFETEVADVSVIDKGNVVSWYYWFGSLPFNSGAFPEIRYQMLQRSELLNASGTVDKIRFQAFTDGTDWSVVEELSIRLAHSSNESLGSNFEANRIDPWVEVLNKSTYTLASEQRGEWVEIDLDTLFEYNGEDNMVVDIRWRGGHAKYLGINLTVDDTITYNGVLGYADYDAETGETLGWMHNIQTIFVDDPQWDATSSDPSLFTAEVIDGNLEITPQPDQHGTGTIELNMMNCNEHLVYQQDIMVTIMELNDPPDAPSNPSPADGAVDVSTSPLLTVDVSDPDGDAMDVTFYDASNDDLIGTATGVASGSTASVTWSGLLLGSMYEWYAVADDGSETTASATWSFTTTDANHAPNAPTDPSPADGAVDVSTTPTLSVDVSDSDGDAMDVTFYNASDDSVIGTVMGVASGSTASVTWSGLSLNTTYEWYAVADDGQDTTQSATWSFTTTDANHAPDTPTYPSPADGAVDVSTSPLLTVDVSDPDGDAMNVTFYNASDDSVIGTATGVASGSTASVTWSGLSLNTTYEWYAVADDGQDTTQSATWSFTTMPAEDTEPPVAVARADRTSISVGETVNFDGSDSTDNVGIVSYTWTIDGEEHDGVTVSYTFENAGTYTIRLVVEDAAGNTDEDTLQVTVTDKEDDEYGDMLWWLLLLAAIMIVIILLVVAIKKKGSKEEYYTEEEPYQESYSESSSLDGEQVETSEASDEGVDELDF